MIGKLVIKRAEPDENGCVRLELWYYPTGGMLGSLNEPTIRRLYLRETEFESLVSAFKQQGLWEVRLEDPAPLFKKMTPVGEGIIPLGAISPDSEDKVFVGMRNQELDQHLFFCGWTGPGKRSG